MFLERTETVSDNLIDLLTIPEIPHASFFDFVLTRFYSRSFSIEVDIGILQENNLNSKFPRAIPRFVQVSSG